MSLIFRRRRHMARSRRHVCFPFVATNGGPSRQNTPFAGWATRGGRSPGSRVVADARLPGNPSGNRERRLSAYSCGGSRGLDRESGLTAFPFFPDGGTTTLRSVDARRRAVKPPSWFSTYETPGGPLGAVRRIAHLAHYGRWPVAGGQSPVAVRRAELHTLHTVGRTPRKSGPHREWHRLHTVWGRGRRAGLHSLHTVGRVSRKCGSRPEARGPVSRGGR